MHVIGFKEIMNFEIYSTVQEADDATLK